MGMLHQQPLFPYFIITKLRIPTRKKLNRNQTLVLPRVEQARRELEIELRISAAQQGWRKRSQKEEALQVDDGLLPSNSDTYAIGVCTMNGM